MPASSIMLPVISSPSGDRRGLQRHFDATLYILYRELLVKYQFFVLVSVSALGVAPFPHARNYDHKGTYFVQDKDLQGSVRMALTPTATSIGHQPSSERPASAAAPSSQMKPSVPCVDEDGLSFVTAIILSSR
jgi:hypothetical protein